MIIFKKRNILFCDNPLLHSAEILNPIIKINPSYIISSNSNKIGFCHQKKPIMEYMGRSVFRFACHL